MLDLVGGERDPSEVREVRDLLGSNVRHPAPMGWGMSRFYRGARGGRNGSRGEGGPNTKRNANAFDDGFAVGGIPYRVGSASAPSKPSAAGPSLTSTANCAASIIRTPSSFALGRFEPAPGPAATKSVFFDTLEAALPPAAMIASRPPSPGNPSRLPAATTLIPARTPPPLGQAPTPRLPPLPKP